MTVHYSTTREESIPDRRDISISRIINAVWVILSIIQGILLLRFGLRLLGANSTAPFVAMIYDVSAFLLIPFRYILPSTVVDQTVFEWGTLLAMFIYWLIAVGITKLVFLARPADRHVVVDEERSDPHYFKER